MTELADLRKNYSLGSLDENNVDPDPVKQFQHWFDYALERRVPEPNAMTLATADADGRPSSRIVLIKGIDARGLVFFTNYLSRKGREVAASPYASVVFYWSELERQVRIEGTVSKTSDAESDEYFHSRPLGSRLGAWISEQSEVVASRAELEARAALFSERYGDDPPRPPHWGGLRLAPERFEFWQGRPSRLHDRIQYTRDPTHGWRIARLAP